MNVIKATKRINPRTNEEEVKYHVNRDKLYFSSPDYSNRESINRITAIGQSWTVDRDGYVYLWRDKSGGDAVGGVVRFFINDIPIFGGTAYYDASINAVSKGDVIDLRTESGATIAACSCHFIPPKYNEIPAPIVEPGSDYSLSEMPVLINDNGNVRQKKDINGDLIYRRTFTGTITAEGATANIEVLEANTAVKAIINVEGWWSRTTAPSDNWAYILPIPSSNVTSDVVSVIYVIRVNASQDNLALSTTSPNARTNAPYEVTVTYTKRS